ncbi:GTP-binding protein [Methanospirillum hungatei]|uniref:CobW family GTP-binding protein n=1 Tax=Methanospirillum hungatei TaxID=2203 RepID=UPI0026EAAB67|nr:GTP-binding protein [Methanospirillum hungatei]MCA1916221.1 GTP-binding protein [Methanospirillum hungatei]
MTDRISPLRDVLAGLWYRRSNPAVPVRRRNSGRLPVYIITGFLGSGKTTCINQVIRSTGDTRFGVIVNDFGSVSIDQHLIEAADGQVIALENGCICCSLRKSLSESIELFLQPDNRPDVLVVEASGVADPAGILSLLAGEEMRKRVRVAGVICLVDADGIRSVSWIMSHLVRKQIRSSDLILLNKTDLVSASVVATVRKEWIPSPIPVLETNHAAFPVSLLFEGLASSHDNDLRSHDMSAHHHPDHEGHGFSTFSWTSVRPIRVSCLKSFLDRMPVDVIRVKGLAYLSELPDQQAIIQVVGKRVSVTKGRSWAGRTPSTMLTFIGTGDLANSSEFTRKLESCVIEH